VSVGGYKFEWNGAAVQEDVKVAMREALVEGSVTLATAMRTNLNKQGPSKPGEFPGVDTRILVGSIDFRLDATQTRAKVGTHKKYGRWLEYGTSKMLPRPWVIRSFELAKGLIHKRMIDEADRVYAERQVARIQSNAGGAK
jgi:hypothetical protein